MTYACDLFHETDGQCCDEHQACWHRAPVRVIPLEPKHIDDELVTQMSLRLLLVLAIMSGLIGLGAAVRLEHHYKDRGQIEQEQIAAAEPHHPHTAEKVTQGGKSE